MRIYIHREGRLEPEATEVEPETRLADAVGVEVTVVVLEDREDGEEELDLALSLREAEVRDGAHIYAGHRHRIEVGVIFNGVEHTRAFSSGTRIERVFHWAVGPEAFELSHADAIEHTLALCSGDEIPAPDVHIGSLVEDRPHHVCLSLIPKHRYEG